GGVDVHPPQRLQPGPQPPDPVQLGLVVRPPAGPSPVRHELVQGVQAGQQFLAAAAGVDQGGGTGQRHLGVMGKNHLAPFHRPGVVPPAQRTFPLTGAAVPGPGPGAPGAAAGNVGLALAVLTAATSGTAGTFASALIGAGWSPGAAVLTRIAVAALILSIPAAVQPAAPTPAPAHPP